MELKLCFVDSERSCAYFTEKEVAKQWGDDWDDAPYEYNAEPPYGEDVKKIFFDLPCYYKVPCSGYLNSPYSVEEINNGVVAWMWNDNFKLMAGDTLDTFITTIEKNDGTVYLEKEKNNGN